MVTLRLSTFSAACLLQLDQEELKLRTGAGLITATGRLQLDQEELKYRARLLPSLA